MKTTNKKIRITLDGNEILGENYNLKLSNEPVDISGGFIIEGKNGRYSFLPWTILPLTLTFVLNISWYRHIK